MAIANPLTITVANNQSEDTDGKLSDFYLRRRRLLFSGNHQFMFL